MLRDRLINYHFLHRRCDARVVMRDGLLCRDSNSTVAGKIGLGGLFSDASYAASFLSQALCDFSGHAPRHLASQRKHWGRKVNS